MFALSQAVCSPPALAAVLLQSVPVAALGGAESACAHAQAEGAFQRSGMREELSGYFIVLIVTILAWVLLVIHKLNRIEDKVDRIQGKMK